MLNELLVLYATEMMKYTQYRLIIVNLDESPIDFLPYKFYN